MKKIKLLLPLNLAVGSASLNVVSCAEVQSFSFHMFVTNGKSDHRDIDNIHVNETIIFTITPYEYCALPETVSVTGAQYEYDKNTGKITISNPVSDVRIEVSCDKIINNINVSGDNVLSYGTQSTYDANVEFVSGKETSYEITCDTGLTGCTWEQSTKTLTAGNKECNIDIAVTVPEYEMLYKYKVHVVPAIFTFGNSGENEAFVSGAALSKEKTGVVATIPKTITQDGVVRTVKYINDSCLRNNIFKQITFPDSIWQINSRSFSSSSIENIIFSDNSDLEGICYEAFRGAKLKGHIIIKSKHSSSNVGPSALESCNNLTAITLPANLKKIFDRAFFGCMNLAEIYFEGTCAQWKSIVREGEWHKFIKAKVVHCKDDDCGLDDTL